MVELEFNQIGRPLDDVQDIGLIRPARGQEGLDHGVGHGREGRPEADRPIVDEAQSGQEQRGNVAIVGEEAVGAGPGLLQLLAQLDPGQDVEESRPRRRSTPNPARPCAGPDPRRNGVGRDIGTAQDEKERRRTLQIHEGSGAAPKSKERLAQEKVQRKAAPGRRKKPGRDSAGPASAAAKASRRTAGPGRGAAIAHESAHSHSIRSGGPTPFIGKM